MTVKEEPDNLQEANSILLKMGFTNVTQRKKLVNLWAKYREKKRL